MQFTGFIGPSYKLDSVNADCQRCVNLFPELNELGTGKDGEIARLTSTPGLKKILAAGPGPGRGIYTSSTKRVFFVSGPTLYELTAGDVATSRGTLDSSSGVASMTDNGQQLVIVAGGKGYYLTLADNTFGQITDENFPVADVVEFLDQYLVVNDRDTGNFQISGLADGTFWDGLDLAQAEGFPDRLITLLVDHLQLFLFGEYSTEIWWNAGYASFPFARVSSAVLEVGIVGPHAKAKIDNGVFFWGKDKNGAGQAFRINGYNPQRVSTHAIETEIKKYGDISGATCYTYQDNGHAFWATNFPGADVTWVLDIATGLWHERTTNYGRHRAEFHAFDGRHLVQDFENGNLYQLDSATYTDNGVAIARIRTAPHLSKQLKRLSHFGLELDLESGVGLADGSDPQVIMRYSDDGGHTWSNERQESMGKVGEYKKRVRFNRLGMSQDRVYEVKVTDPVPVTLLAAFLDIG